MKTIIAIDQAHQAIGRNSGYRWHDNMDLHFSPPKCIVLIDPLMYRNFIASSRYYLNEVGLLDKEIRQRPENNQWDKHLLFWMKNYVQYMSTGEFLYHDTMNCLKEPGLPHKATRAKRTIKAIYSVLEEDTLPPAARDKITSTVLRIETDIKNL